MKKDAVSFEYKVRRFSNRLVNFVRPKPRYLPLTVEQVLEARGSRDLVERFNDFYYSGGIAGNLSWRGSQMIKNPCDLWTILEIFQRLKPSVVLETGTHHGGSATFYADMLKLLEIPARVITVDINPKWEFDPASRGITSVRGFSTDPAVVEQVKASVTEQLKQRPGPVMVLLDSDHSEANVTEEIRLYSDLVTPGSYLVVEDTNVNGHPSAPTHGPGPWEAVDKFLANNKNFVFDESCQRFLLTFNPRGWLKRVK